MASVDSSPSVGAATSSSSTTTFNLTAYKETALLLLAFIMPPAAIAVRQGKVDLESRHLAVSLALYLSVIFYLPSVVHAYWLLYVRDNGGVEEWAGARWKQADGLWKEHGGVVKAKVDEYAPQVSERLERARTYTTEKVKYANDAKDQTVDFVTKKTAAVFEVVEDAKEAYASGTVIDWTKEKIHAAVEKVKALLESYPRVQAVVHYVEQRVPLVLEFLGKIYETIRAKLQPKLAAAAVVDHDDDDEEEVEPSGDDSTMTCGDILTSIPRPDLEEKKEEEKIVNDEDDDHEGTDSTVESPKSSGTAEYETAGDTTRDESFNEGRTEEEYSQEL